MNGLVNLGNRRARTRGVVAHLRAAGITVLVLQPVQVKAYARVHLRRAKEEGIARFKVRLEHVDESRLRRIVTSDIARLRHGGTRST
jgi:transposase